MESWKVLVFFSHLYIKPAGSSHPDDHGSLHVSVGQRGGDVIHREGDAVEEPLCRGRGNGQNQRNAELVLSVCRQNLMDMVGSPATLPKLATGWQSGDF